MGSIITSFVWVSHKCKKINNTSLYLGISNAVVWKEKQLKAMHGYYDTFRIIVSKTATNQREKGISKYFSFHLPTIKQTRDDATFPLDSNFVQKH